MYSFVKKFLKLLKTKIDNFLLIEDAESLFYKKKLDFRNPVSINLMSFSKLNPNVVFYVIKRSLGAGLFSNLIYVLNHLNIADKNRFIPIVDMKNFTTIYNEKNKIDGNYNAWEYYFENVSKYSLEEVYKSQNVVITKDKFFKNFSHVISNKKFRKIGDKYFKIKKKFNKISDNYFKKNLNEKTLAIHYRGTSYKTSANHPFPATINNTIEYCKFLLRKYGYKKIFLCTEDLELFNEMKKNFKSNLYSLNSYRSFKDDAFKIYPRKNHRYKLGEEILVESLIISKCNGFIHAETNVSEFVKFLDKQNKIRFFFLDNGLNTSNEYFAPYLWHFKNIAPEALGGFKKIKYNK